MEIKVEAQKLTDTTLDITIDYDVICIEFQMYVKKVPELVAFALSPSEDDIFVFGDDDENGMALHYEEDCYVLRTEETTNITISLSKKQVRDIAMQAKKLTEMMK